jgi:hypothetical protein
MSINISSSDKLTVIFLDAFYMIEAQMLIVNFKISLFIKIRSQHSRVDYVKYMKKKMTVNLQTKKYQNSK